MDDLRLALLIVGVVVVAGVWIFARLSRRKAAESREDPNHVERESHHEGVDDEDAHDPDESGSLDFLSAGEAGDTEAEVGRLGGIFAPRREAYDSELSVDVNILAGLRATYESTLDTTFDGTLHDAPDDTLDGSADHTVEGSTAPEPSVDRGVAEPSEDADAARPIAIDMSRPLVYLTLVAKQERVSGQVVLDSLDAEDFRPGLMQLYYWRADEEPSVVFGVANMVEPGVLDPDELPGMETPGLVTFMSVPEDTASAFRILDTMIAVSRRLARRLDAMLCDETRSTLTAQAENHLRETVADILRRDRT